VNFLLTHGQRDFFSADDAEKSRKSDLWTRLRRSLRLTRRLRRVESVPFQQASAIAFSTVAPAIHRFEESIGGQSYLIEARSVDRDRWRAYIVRIPGVPTALMPFYGRTPDEAAKHLSDWLTRAHERVTKTTGSA
jgi:hypothetical protein